MKKEDRVKIESDFYGDCAELLGTEYEYSDHVPGPKVDRKTNERYTPPTKASRWGGREVGNGCFPGFGLIRLHWPNLVIIRLNNPKPIWATIYGLDEALDFLRKELSNG